ncbi:MAG TPA: ABC transporter substrate-binding protein [Stellaceae bacterium]|nr:ABC transporter substrate-binding protein [Stellaceae bacterium]
MRLGKSWRAGLLAAPASFAMTLAAAAAPADQEPIKIAVISEESAILGQSISAGAKLAAADINAKGGINGRKIEIIVYDDHSSAADAVRAYQRAVQQDHVSAVVATFISEVYLALEPWAARLHTPTITAAAASNLITKQVHDDYDRFKYVFEGWLPSPIIAQAVCDSSHDILVGMLHMKSAAIVSEDADWTTPLDAAQEKCLPEAGLKVVDHVRFNPDTTDFTPIYTASKASTPTSSSPVGRMSASNRRCNGMTSMCRYRSPGTTPRRPTRPSGRRPTVRQTASSRRQVPFREWR